jgi:hypothetical protein
LRRAQTHSAAQTHSVAAIHFCYRIFTFLPFAFEKRKETANRDCGFLELQRGLNMMGSDCKKAKEDVFIAANNKRALKNIFVGVANASRFALKNKTTRK